jgi:hypothetical protein
MRTFAKALVVVMAGLVPGATIAQSTTYCYHVGTEIMCSSTGAPGQAPEQTNCYHVGTEVMCNSTGAPPPDTDLQQSESNFGSALGMALGDLAERIRERRAAAAAARAQNAQGENVAGSDAATSFGAQHQSDFAPNQGEQARPQASQSADLAPYIEQVKEFAASADHPYFGLVRERMIALLQNGQAETLQQAYDLAVAQDPRVQSLIANRSR